jgi:hypothetical protein
LPRYARNDDGGGLGLPRLGPFATLGVSAHRNDNRKMAGNDNKKSLFCIAQKQKTKILELNVTNGN